mmetsp:Transcript_25655/g.72635  ORF Transcript_25655/g.72635 Transcript_25655/m.72635 type:complete len:325 (-) Transcript_25655:80-1054(-)
MPRGSGPRAKAATSGRPDRADHGTKKGADAKGLKRKRARQDAAISRYDDRGRAQDQQAKRMRALGGADRAVPRKEAKSEAETELERKLAKRYHKAKFFDRIKVERMLKSNAKSLAQAPTDRELMRKKKELLDDLRYIKFFPRGNHYISLFKTDLTEEQTELRAKHRAFALQLSMRSSRGKNSNLLAFITGKEKVDRRLIDPKKKKKKAKDQHDSRTGKDSKLDSGKPQSGGPLVDAATAGEEEDDFFLDDDEEETAGGEEQLGAGESDASEGESARANPGKQAGKAALKGAKSGAQQNDESQSDFSSNGGGSQSSSDDSDSDSD